MEDVPCASTWTLYGHGMATSESYASAYTTICTVSSFSDFGRMWNHTHPRLVASPTRIVAIGGRRITSWSFFKNNVKPEWEDPANAAGVTYTLRAALDEEDAYRLWETLVSECVLGTHPAHLNGVQLTRKSSGVRHGEPGLYVKVDLWFASRDDPCAWIRARLAPYAFLPASRDAPTERRGRPR